MSFPDAVILLTENPPDPDALKALRIISEHGVGEEAKLAAKLLLKQSDP